MSAEKEIFVGAEKGKIEGVCGEVSCSETHFSDLAKSLNSLGNSLIGCSSGIGVRILSFLFPFTFCFHYFVPCILWFKFKTIYLYPFVGSYF